VPWAPTTDASLVEKMLLSLSSPLPERLPKKIAGNGHPQRNTQFEYIAMQRRRCGRRTIPLISVDTKKKEVVGPFRNAGTVWSRQPRAVRDHDFRSEGIGMAVPYGIYDVGANRGAVFVGTSHDTADFALDKIAKRQMK
jgi:hypothetical protein